MPISFFDLLADEGWEPLDFFQGDPTFYWNDGGFIANAPVDIAATLDGAMWRSTNVESAFRWQGRRIRCDAPVFCAIRSANRLNAYDSLLVESWGSCVSGMH